MEAKRECRHATCGPVCRRPKKPPAPRKPIQRKPIPKKVRTPLKRSKKRINPYSQKRVKINRVYSALSKQFVSDNPYCKIKSPECTGRTEGPHHPEGRLGNKLTDLESCIPACNACNLYVEVHDSWARERGFKKSRLTKVAKCQ